MSQFPIFLSPVRENREMIREKYPDYVILDKSGIFYNAIGEDAIFKKHKSSKVNKGLIFVVTKLMNIV